MKFTDASPIAGTRRTADGYLVAEAKVARTGIQLYAGREVGRPELSVVRVYRPAEEVFHRDSVSSFSHAPVTVDHPAEMVTDANWKDLAVGETSGEVLRDGERLRIPLIVKDSSAISKIESGKRELSAGYTCDLAFEAGETPNGEAYDAVQRNIRANHVAIVAKGRAGAECRIGDAEPEHWGAAPIYNVDSKDGHMSDKLATVVLGDKAVQVADAAAPIIENFKTAFADEKAKLITDHAAQLAAKDADLAKKDAELDALKAKVLSDADLDARVQARADLIATAKMIAGDVQVVGMPDAEIRKAVVVAKLGDAAIKDKAEAYIDARFDILAEDARKADPLRQAIQSQDRQTVTVNDNGQSAYEARLRDAWKQATPARNGV